MIGHTEKQNSSVKISVTITNQFCCYIIGSTMPSISSKLAAEANNFSRRAARFEQYRN